MKKKHAAHLAPSWNTPPGVNLCDIVKSLFFICLINSAVHYTRPTTANVIVLSLYTI